VAARLERGFGILLYAVAALAVIGALGGLYYKVNNDGYQRGKGEVQTAWDAANEKARAEEAARSAAAAKALAEAKAKRRVVIQERTVYVDKIVDRPVYRNQCFDADGLRCIGSAIRGESAAGCKPDGGMPATAAPDRNDRGGGPALGLILDRTVPGLRGG